jgi:hypothetical protein
MEVEHKAGASKGLFILKNNGDSIGRMSYSKAGDDKIIIDHTEVEEAFKGQGLGVQMVDAAVKFARDNHISIIPLCPFARSVFDKTPQYGDVLS